MYFYLYFSNIIVAWHMRFYVFFNFQEHLFFFTVVKSKFISFSLLDVLMLYKMSTTESSPLVLEKLSMKFLRYIKSLKHLGRVPDPAIFGLHQTLLSPACLTAWSAFHLLQNQCSSAVIFFHFCIASFQCLSITPKQKSVGKRN